jgi:hypothetical protein
MTTSPVGSSTPASRYLLIVITYGVAIYQATRGFWFEVAGLVGLGTGLVLLIAASRRPPAAGRTPLRWAAVICFAVTAAAVYYVYRRDYL